jgi:copper chaperone CopZ
VFGVELRSVTGKPLKISMEYMELSREGVKPKDVCPVSGSRGHRVMKVTVSNHVDSRLWHYLKSDWFWFCSDPGCPVVYYNNELGVYFLKDEVKTRVFQKELSEDRPVCYCLSVTEAMIREEILVKRCCDSLEDIQKFTKAGTGRWCPITNPSGKCCKEYLGELIESILRERGVEEGLRSRLEDLRESFRLEIPSKPSRGEAIVLVEGMSCEGCAVAVRAALENSGALVKTVDWRSGLVHISNLGELKPEDLKDVIEAIGYRVSRIISGGS